MSIQNNIMKWYLRTTITKIHKKTKGRPPTVKGFRRSIEKATAHFKHPSSVKLESTKIGENNAEWFIPKSPVKDKVLLYLHGGGYIGGTLKSCRGIAGKIAEQGAVKVLSLDYRLAPEHPYPAALEDAIEAFNWLQNQGYAANQIIVSGDSAGGGLSLCLAIALRDQFAIQPLALVLLSPWTDLSASCRSILDREERDPIFNAKDLAPTGALYAGELSLKDPKVSPFFADPKGLCPILIQVGTEEVLFDDSNVLAQKYKQAGVDVSLEVWEGTSHVWHIAWKFVPESRKAIKKIGHFIKNC